MISDTNGEEPASAMVEMITKVNFTVYSIYLSRHAIVPYLRFELKWKVVIVYYWFLIAKTEL